MDKLETFKLIIWKTSDDRTKYSQIWDSNIYIVSRPCMNQGHFVVIWYTWDIPKILFSRSLLLLQITADIYQLNYLPNGPCKPYLGFLKFRIFFVSFSLTSDQLGEKLLISFSPNKSHPTLYKLVLNFPLKGPHKKRFWNFEFLILNDFCFQKIQIHHFTIWRNPKRQLSGNERL